MNVLVLGSGGREHALCYTLQKSSQLQKLYAIPGNPGIAKYAQCVDIDPMNNELIKTFAIEQNIHLVIPGSEVYLENGIANSFIDTNILVFGPTKESAMIESSKRFAKDLMKEYHIPTAQYEVFYDYQKAVQYIQSHGVPIVIKYDGLAGGKGVVIATTFEEADETLQNMLVSRQYGNQGVVIEEYLEGPEFSLLCFVHHDTIIPMPIAQDHKRLYDQDRGPNTGGMGVYSGVPMIPNEVIKASVETIMKPTINALISKGFPFTGFLYGGLMLTDDGPKVIEFNARFGDPECEVILPRLQTDLLAIIQGLYHKQIPIVQWDHNYHVGVVLASEGYPQSYQKGFLIKQLETIKDPVFHMGTIEKDNQLLTNGGRVLLVTGQAPTLEEAIEQVYKNVNNIQCENLVYRTDIGKKSIKE